MSSSKVSEGFSFPDGSSSLPPLVDVLHLLPGDIVMVQQFVDDLPDGWVFSVQRIREHVVCPHWLKKFRNGSKRTNCSSADTVRSLEQLGWQWSWKTSCHIIYRGFRLITNAGNCFMLNLQPSLRRLHVFRSVHSKNVLRPFRRIILCQCQIHFLSVRVTVQRTSLARLTGT